MGGFADEAPILVKAGNGGAGAVSFRREKYVPRGGPDGGDGGRGGDVVFVVRANLKTLSHLRYRGKYNAANGGQGAGRHRTGGDGADVEIPVPPGTVIRDAETAELLVDLKVLGERWVFLRGGRGGKGNSHFTTSTHQTPRFSQPGEPGGERQLLVELRLIADVGLIGFPNAGKSTLLSRLTHATPKIAAYPFTTTTPHLGVLRLYDQDIIIADIPGLIEGAADGAGMGHRFLRHVSRSAALAYLVDLCEPDPAQAVAVLAEELRRFSPDLAGRRRLIVGTKLDVSGTAERLEALRDELPGDRIVGISAVTGLGLEELGRTLLELSGGRE